MSWGFTKSGTASSVDWTNLEGKPSYLNRIEVNSVFWLKGDGNNTGDIKAVVTDGVISYVELKESGWEPATLVDINLSTHGSLNTRLTALESAREFTGGLDASGALSQLDDAVNGYYWIVNVAGTLDSIEMSVNDMVICHTDVTGTPTDLSNFSHIPSVIDDMVGCTSSANGSSGKVPQPIAGDEKKYLHGDGTWKNPYPALTQSGDYIGLGTESPSTEFHVKHTGANSEPAICIENDAQAWQIQTRGTDSDNFSVWDVTNDISRVNITKTGRMGIGTTTPASTLEVNGFSKLGSDAPAIKMKKYTGNMPAVGQSIYIAHGLTSAKIIAMSCIVFDSNGTIILPNINSTEVEYYFRVNTNDTSSNKNSLWISTGSGASQIAGRPYTVILTYEE